MNDPMINLNGRLTVRMTQIVALELSPLYPSVFVHLCSGQRFELNETRYEDAVALYKRLQSLIQPAPKRSCLFPVTTPASGKSTNALTRSYSPFTGEFKTRLKTLVDNERFDELKRALDCGRNSFGRG